MQQPVPSILYYLYSDAGLRISITDNGKGFAREQLFQSQGMGRFSMHHRARLIGAELEVSSTSETGTSIVIYAPILLGAFNS